MVVDDPALLGSTWTVTMDVNSFGRIVSNTTLSLGMLLCTLLYVRKVEL